MRFRGVFSGLGFLLSLTPSLHSQWEIQDAHTTASLRGIHYLGKGVAWASGTGGTVLRTEDMGFVWQLCTVPPGAEKLDFRGVQAFDNNTAIVMSSGKGDLSRLYKTTDGCQTWKLVFTNPDAEGFWDAIKFTRRKDGGLHGWIFGDPVDGRFRIFQSVDATLDHFRADDKETLATPVGGGAAFAASNSAFFEMENGPPTPVGNLLPPPRVGEKRTSNYQIAHLPMQWFVTGGTGGSRVYVRGPEQIFDVSTKVSWIPHELPVGTASASSGAFAIVVRSISNGVIVGGDYSKPGSGERTAAYRDPVRKAWVASKTPPSGYRSAVGYDSHARAWITVGPNGTDISTDDGRNWRPLRPGPGDAPDADKNWNALSLPFVVGPKGRIGLLRDLRSAVPDPK